MSGYQPYPPSYSQQPPPTNYPPPPNNYPAPAPIRYDPNQSQSHHQHQQPSPVNPNPPPIYYSERGPPPPGNSSLPPIHYPERGPAPPLPGLPPQHEQFRGGRGSLPERRDGRGRSPDARGSKRMTERDHPVQERLKLERPCRTLFVRNVAYEADTSQLRSSFESYGDIKNWFDIIQKRGMIFITYFDTRAAQRARDAMHDLKVMGRSIDVHYSLPKSDEQTGRPDRESNQGSLNVTLRHQRFLDEYEFSRLGERFGDIKQLNNCREPDQKVIDFFDSRAAVLMFDEMHDKPFMGGVFDMRYMWDEPEPSLPPPPATGRNHAIEERKPYRGGEGPGYGDVRGREPPPGRRSEDRYSGPPGRYDDRRGDSGPPGPPQGGYDDRRGSYPPAPPPASYGDGPPAPTPVDDRLEQARKVQQLLADLGKSGTVPSTPSQPPYNPPPANRYPSSQNSSMPPPPSADPRGPPPAQSQYARPPPSNYPPYRPPGSSASPPRPPASQSYPPQQSSYAPPPQSSQSSYAPPPHSGQSSYGPPSQSSQPSYPSPLQRNGGRYQASPADTPGYGPPPSQQIPHGGYGGPPPSQGYGGPPSRQNDQGQGLPPSSAYGPPPTQAGAGTRGYNPASAPPSDVGSLLAMLKR